MTPTEKRLEIEHDLNDSRKALRELLDIEILLPDIFRLGPREAFISFGVWIILPFFKWLLPIVMSDLESQLDHHKKLYGP